MSDDYFVGLDLGQSQDFTALAVLQRSLADPDQENSEYVFSLRHLDRYPLGTPYTTIVPSVAELSKSDVLRGSPVIVDQTGVGRALVDMLRRAPLGGQLVPVTITAGQKVTKVQDGAYHSWHVPKKDLVTSLQLLLESRRLKVARTLEHAETLVREMQNFRVKITASLTETFEAWREGQHDDLVLAVALACWWAQRWPRWSPRPRSDRGKCIFADPPKGVFR